MKSKRTAVLVLVLAGLAAVPLRAETPKPATVPFKLLLTKHITLMIKVNGKGPYRVIFDTGSPVNLLSTKVGREAGLVAKDGGFFSILGSATEIKAKELEVGGLKARSVPVIVMDHPTIQVISSILGPVEGIVGFPFFAHYRMTLDYQAMQMTLVPTAFEPKDVIQTLMATLTALDRPAVKVLAPAGIWGFSVAKSASDQNAGVVIKQVLAGGAAERAGFKAGDRLLTLDGRWTDSVNDCYEAAAQVPAGAEITALLERQGKGIEVQIKPQPGL